MKIDLCDFRVLSRSLSPQFGHYKTSLTHSTWFPFPSPSLRVGPAPRGVLREAVTPWPPPRCAACCSLPFTTLVPSPESKFLAEVQSSHIMFLLPLLLQPSASASASSSTRKNTYIKPSLSSTTLHFLLHVSVPFLATSTLSSKPWAGAIILHRPSYERRK